MSEIDFLWFLIVEFGWVIGWPASQWLRPKETSQTKTKGKQIKRRKPKEQLSKPRKQIIQEMEWIEWFD